MKFIILAVTLLSTGTLLLALPQLQDFELNEQCVDRREECPKYAAMENGEYCSNQKDFMKVYCRKSCGFCTFNPPKKTGLIWKTGEWQECKNGVEERYVRCYDEYKLRVYHVDISYCQKKLEDEEPIRRRPCSA